jgi:4-amino-4-deoxy-L-arabinose transferase-like glycosyltransferase
MPPSWRYIVVAVANVGITYSYGTTPPVFDIVTTLSFGVFRLNPDAGRIVAVTFSLLAIVLVYEFAKPTSTKTRMSPVTLGHPASVLLAKRVTRLRPLLLSFYAVIFTFFGG